MYRSLISTFVLALGLTACHPHQPSAGGAPKVEHHPIAAGESNRFFVANTAHTFAIAADVRATPVNDSAGHRKGFRLRAPDNTIATVTCDCPATCSPGGHAPVSSACWTLGDSVDSPRCSASCGGGDEGCGSCGLTYWQGPAAGTVEEPADVAMVDSNARKQRAR